MGQVMALRRFLSLGVLAAMLGLSARALAHDEQSERPAASRPFDKDQGTNPLRGSTLLLEQSMTTQTAGLGTTPQSYVPLYELWLSLRPRYFFDEHWSVRGRFDYTKELTNNQPTTLAREDVFGDIWTDLVYGTTLDSLWKGTKADVGLRALWPTSKISRGNGTYVTLGGRAGASHDFEIKGDDAPALNSAHVALRFVYLHPFSTATTPTGYGGFAYVREDTDAHSFVSDQLQGSTLVNHEVWASLEGGLQITPKLSLTAYMIFINQWHYIPQDHGIALTSTGPVTVPRSANDEQFTQNTWLLATLDYELFEELDLSLGYYDLANYIAPDGQRRGVFGSDNVWWSPDARVFFTVTANLDALYDDALRHRYSKRAAQSARLPGVLGGLR